MSGQRERMIKLFCPSLSKVVPFVAWEEQTLDLGSIARSFGLDPATLKLNGHFISRGVDLVASSVTWKSLLSFFSARGLSTGTTDADALIVDGKLSKVGTKRYEDGAIQITKCKRLGPFDLKRKQWLEDITPLKRLRGNETHSGFQGRENHPSIPSTKFPCNYISEHVKRMREDDIVVTAPSKRTRS